MNTLRQLWRHLTYGADGTPSTLTFWTSVAYLTVTFVVIWQTVQDQISTELILVYLGAVAGQTFATRAFNSYVNRKDAK